MSWTLLLTMTAFALAASISPGPVNLLGLSCGLRHGIRPGLMVQRADSPTCRARPKSGTTGR